MSATVETAAAVPEHATDCHAHVFDPQRFPYADDRRYTPPPATVDELSALHARLGIERVVLVQPSVYGTDNRCLLAALDRLGDRARGIAVIADAGPASDLQAMHERGVRGVRLNLQVARESHTAAIRRRILRLSQRLDDLPWIIQLYAALPTLVELVDTLTALPQRVLIDHFAMPEAAAGTAQGGFDRLLELLARPNVHVKLSGPYQISVLAPDYGDITPIARALYAAAPDRTVWGSDWPHPGGARRSANAKAGDIEPFRDEDDAHNLGLVARWFPDADVRRSVLADNPDRLFGFGSGPAMRQ